jgi:hypothetical protein
VHTNGVKGGGDHGGYQGWGRGGAGRDNPRATRALRQFGKERRADGALLAGATVTVGAGPSSGHIHEEAKLVINIQLRISGNTEPHLVAFPFLVLFAGKSVERGAAHVLAEAGIVVRVEDQVA